jgi:hypothetical protein
LFPNAQNFELGKVSVEELKQRVHPKDTAVCGCDTIKKGKTVFKYENEKDSMHS